MKLIFLDIDGVMISSDFLSEFPSARKEEIFVPACIERINEIAEATGASIVVSSSWRYDRDLETLQALFEKNAIKAKVIGATPISRDFTTMRGQEIQQFLDGLARKGEVADAFVIFDDEENMMHLEPFYVQTDFRVGISEADKDAAIEMLGRKD